MAFKDNCDRALPLFTHSEELNILMSKSYSILQSGRHQKVSCWYFWPLEISLEGGENTQHWLHRITQGATSQNSKISEKISCKLGMVKMEKGIIFYLFICKGRNTHTPFSCWILFSAPCLINRDISVFLPRLSNISTTWREFLLSRNTPFDMCFFRYKYKCKIYCSNC